MNRILEANRYELPLSKQHESRMQHLRYEQKAEGHRLERPEETFASEAAR